MAVSMRLKTFTKHPFLDRYGDELQSRIALDRSKTLAFDMYIQNVHRSYIRGIASWRPNETTDLSYVKLFPILVQEIIDRTTKGQGVLAHVYDLLDESKIQEQDIKKHFKWILLKYLKGGIPRLEDMSSTIDNIAIYEALKKRGLVEQQYYDLNRFRSSSDLSNYVYSIWDQSNKGEISPDRIQKLIRNGELEVYYEDSTMVVYNILTSKACELTGSADWCTTRGAFNNYKKDGDLYTIHIKGKPDERYHLSFARFEFTDENNSPIIRTDVLKLNLDSVFKGSIFDKSAKQHRIKEIVRAYESNYVDAMAAIDSHGCWSGEIFSALESYPHILKYFRSETQMAYLALHPEHIDHADMYTVRNFIEKGGWEAIQYVHWPDIELQFSAIRQSPKALALIDDPYSKSEEHHAELWPDTDIPEYRFRDE